jgi:hypothetical protein
MENMPLALLIQKMSYVDAILYQILQKESDTLMGSVFLVVPRMGVITISTMLAGKFNYFTSERPYRPLTFNA